MHTQSFLSERLEHLQMGSPRQTLCDYLLFQMLVPIFSDYEQPQEKGSKLLISFPHFFTRINRALLNLRESFCLQIYKGRALNSNQYFLVPLCLAALSLMPVLHIQVSQKSRDLH